jgi:hypothetical protein
MKPLEYSSAAAFVAHYRILSNAAAHGDNAYPLSARDNEILNAMNRLMEMLSPEERVDVLADTESGDGSLTSAEQRRRRERTRLRLRRLLAENGIVRG